MQHELKIRPGYFGPLKAGRKTAELRKDDRNYQVGDILHLREYDNGKYTGRCISVDVTHVLRNCEEYGLMSGYCILSIKARK